MPDIRIEHDFDRIPFERRGRWLERRSARELESELIKLQVIRALGCTFSQTKPKAVAEERTLKKRDDPTC
jgi:hypothetical protein